MAYKKLKIIQETFSSDNEGQNCYMLLIFVEDDLVKGTVAVQLQDGFKVFDELLVYHFYGIGFN
jgi:hypothetical protein